MASVKRLVRTRGDIIVTMIYRNGVLVYLKRIDPYGSFQWYANRYKSRTLNKGLVHNPVQHDIYGGDSVDKTLRFGVYHTAAFGGRHITTAYGGKTEVTTTAPLNLHTLTHAEYLFGRDQFTVMPEEHLAALMIDPQERPKQRVYAEKRSPTHDSPTSKPTAAKSRVRIPANHQAVPTANVLPAPRPLRNRHPAALRFKRGNQ